MEDTEMERVQVSFVTKDPQFSVSGYPIYVQLDSDRGDLSDMVKSLLSSDHDAAAAAPAEFEFLVQEELLVGSLRQLVQERALPMDSVLRAEYFPRRAAPAPHAQLAMGDFVSCVRARGGRLLVGCYDRSVVIGDVDGATGLALPGAHDKEVKAVDWLWSDDNHEEEEELFVSAGHDQDCRVWRRLGRRQPASYEAACLAVCKGHAASVMCVAGSPAGCGGGGGGHFASGSFDGQVKLWRTGSGVDAAGDLEPETGGIGHQSKHAVPRRVPLRTLAGHRDAVHAVTYAGGPSQLATGGADSCARLWDVEVGAETALLRAPSAFLSLHCRSQSGGGALLLLAGCAGPQPRLYDPRSPGDTLAACFNAHDSWVSAVRWCPTVDHLFVSGGYEGLVKLWDLRCVRAPLYDLRDHDGIVTSVDWTETGHVVSASADCTVKVFKADLA